jgi:type IV secretion system protein VirB11
MLKEHQAHATAPGPLTTVHELTEADRRRRNSLRTAMLPIVPFLDDDSIVEIMLNADGTIWIDKMGLGMVRTDARMTPEAAETMLKLIAARATTELNEQNPSLSNVQLPGWGARVQAAVPPIVDAPVFALRKPAKIVFTLDDYVQKEILSTELADALRAAIHARQNILVGGGTGTGKTTLANALLQVISETHDRVFIVEDTPELQCTAPNKLQVRIRPPGYTWQRAIMDAMRFRPDRIVVGEVRDGSALELLKSWNTGHAGGLGTVHANDPGAMLDRICQLIEEVVPTAPRALIAETINICVHIHRDPKHPAGRRISGVDRVHGIDSQGRWILRPLQ